MTRNARVLSLVTIVAAMWVAPSRAQDARSLQPSLGKHDLVTFEDGLAAVPEPAVYMLMGLGGLLCVQAFRRKRS